MDKLRSAYNYILQANFAYILILGLLIKALLGDISYPTFLLTIPILAFEGYKLFLKSKTPDPVRINGEVMRELDQIKAKLSAVSLEKGVKTPAQRYF